MAEGINDDKKAAALFETEQLKTVILVIPLIGAIIAITYDVGYFFGVDINYFTVFSLAEHLVFALEPVPFAIVMAFCLVSLWTFASQRQEPKGSLARPKISSFMQQIINLVGLLVPSLLLWWFTDEEIVFVPLVLLVISKSLSRRGYRVMARFADFGVTMLFLVFCMGYLTGSIYIKGNIPTHILNDLIRAGERGILFATKEPRQVAFFRWDGIRSIKTLELSEADKRALKWGRPGTEVNPPR